MHAALDETDAWNHPSDTATTYVDHVVRLDHALADSGSADTVDTDTVRQLVERVDPTVDALLLGTIADAAPTAGGLLRDARHHLYGLHLLPDARFAHEGRAADEHEPTVRH